MARLQKSFQDYFRLPILLQSLSPAISNLQSFKKLYQSLRMQQIMLPIDDRYEINPQYTEFQNMLSPKFRNHIFQRLEFFKQQFNDEWKDLQIIYNNRFTVGVYDLVSDIQQRQRADLVYLWNNFIKLKHQEDRKVLGLIILTTNSQIKMQGIKQSYIIIPQTIPHNQVIPFLEPWFYSCLSIAQGHICALIKELQCQNNKFIVFNRLEDKTQQRIIRKKKKARCLKLCGDLCLSVHAIDQAYKYYLQSEELLRKIDDYIWIVSCLQGKLACFTTDIQFDNKEQLIEQTRIECLAIAKKIKIPKIEAQTYFKILKIYKQIPSKFDQIAISYCTYISHTHSNAQKFLHLVQMAQLYKQAGLFRRYASLVYQSAAIVIDIKPEIGLMLLRELKQNSKIKQWPLIYSNILKLQIEHSSVPNSGKTHLQMLQKCAQFLSFKNIENIVDSFNYAGFTKIEIDRQISFVKVLKYQFIESKRKPKMNRISKQYESPLKKKSKGGVLVSWRKNQQKVYLYQAKQPIQLKLLIENTLRIVIQVKISLQFSHGIFPKPQKFILKPSSINQITVQFSNQQIGEYYLQAIQFSVWNFSWNIQTQSIMKIKPKFQIYQQYPTFQIQLDGVKQIDTNSYEMRQQQSSQFCYEFSIKRNKPKLSLSHIKLSVSIYYHLDIGLQETEFMLSQLNQQSKHEYRIVSRVCIDQDNNIEKFDKNTNKRVLDLKQLRADKKQIKKIQMKLEYIRTQQSKYQLGNQISINYDTYQQISCTIKEVTTQLQSNQLFSQICKQNKQSKFICQNYVIMYEISKKQNNRILYVIRIQQQKYYLGEQTQIIITNKYPKITQQKIKQQFQLTDGKLIKNHQIYWYNYMNTNICGNIKCPLIYQQSKMLIQPIEVKMEVKSRCDRFIQIKNQQSLPISYTVLYAQKQQDIAHQFIVKPLKYPQLRSYLIYGKTSIKSKAHNKQNSIQNKLILKFISQYSQEYVIGLKFRSGWQYWHQNPIKISQKN